MAYRKKFSASEKKEYMEKKVQELQETLERGVKDFQQDPEKVKAILEMQALLPSYSFRNLIVAKSQLEHARFLAPYKRWKELGRYPKKGSKALRIFAPRFRNEEKEEVVDGKTITVEDKRLVGFVAVPVFDYSQTEGNELPIDRVQLELVGDSPEARKIINMIHEIADLPISYVDTGVAKGVYYPKEHRIEVHKEHSINQQAKTLVHEYVHSRVHREASHTTAEEREVVAESTAFVVCTYFGLDTSDYSFEYVKGWSKTDDALLKYGTQISDISRSIISDLQPLEAKYEEQEGLRVS